MVENRFLITTALESTWQDDVPVLFLGEWCLLHSRKERWSAMNAEVLPYHWDDRSKFYSDYQYLKDVHERLLRDLTVRLNQIHSVHHSLRYWRILVGPWLGYFTQALFDRWVSIQLAVNRSDVYGTTIITGHDDSFIPSDMTNFIAFMCGDEWNHHIYATILQQFTKASSVRHVHYVRPSVSTAPPRISWRRRPRTALATWYTRVQSIRTKDRDAFFLATYLPFRDEARLYRRLGQGVQRWCALPCAQVPAYWSMREWLLAGEDRSGFESCARALIPKQLPTIYLEGYGQLVQQTTNLPWPSRPKVIWTSNACYSDEVFKAWAAEKVEKGAPLVIGQHGGHYGVGRWSFADDHEIAICDRYLSWGWSQSGEPKVEPVGQFVSRVSSGVRHAEQPGALLVTCTTPRHSYFMYSAMVSRQWLDYFRDQCTFVEHLPRPIRSALTVRLHTNDYGWDQVRRWRERFPSLHLDDGKGSIYGLIRVSRLYISTYNATTFLESFSMNVPTVIYWNPRHWELRDSAIPFFEELRQVGIFHATPESAARHVASVWNNVDAWWSSPEVRVVLGRFKERYCHTPGNMLDKLEHALRKVISV